MKTLLIVGAVICKLRGFEAKRQQMNNILHRQRSSLSQGSIFSESLLRNLDGKINWDFSEERNNVERFFTSVKSVISYEIRKFAGIFDSVISIPNNAYLHLARKKAAK